MSQGVNVHRAAPALLDLLPADVQVEVLRGVQCSARQTCVTFRDIHDAEVEAMTLRWPQEPLSADGSAQLQALLSKLPQLRDLRVAGHTESSAGCLTAVALPSLTALSLRHCAVVDITPLASCLSLRVLDLSYCAQVTDFSPLQSCVSLLSLDLRHCVLLSDITPLGSCTALRALELSRCAFLQDITPLASCTTLLSLGMRHCYKIFDITPLASCSLLVELDLKDCHQVAHTTPLSACTALRSLHLGPGMLRSLHPLQFCTALAILHLEGTLVSDLGPLATCSQLVSLSVSRCLQLPPESGLTALAACTLLQDVKLASMHGLNVEPLKACLRLRLLHLVFCEGFQGVDRLAALLPELEVRVKLLSTDTDCDVPSSDDGDCDEFD